MKLQLITELICIYYKTRGECLQSLPSALLRQRELLQRGLGPLGGGRSRGVRGLLDPTRSQGWICWGVGHTKNVPHCTPMGDRGVAQAKCGARLGGELP